MESFSIFVITLFIIDDLLSCCKKIFSEEIVFERKFIRVCHYFIKILRKITVM